MSQKRQAVDNSGGKKKENNMGKDVALDLCKPSRLQTPGNFCPSSVSFSSCFFRCLALFSYFFDKRLLKGRRFISAHSSIVQSIMAVSQGSVRLKHLVTQHPPASRKQATMNAFITTFNWPSPLLTLPRTPCLGNDTTYSEIIYPHQLIKCR